MLSVSLYLVHEHCILPRDETAEKTDAGRVAPISACVSSSTKYYHQTLSLMGATRFEAADKIAVYRVKSSFSSLF